MAEVYKRKSDGERFFKLDSGKEYTWLGNKLSTRDCFRITHQDFKENYESDKTPTTMLEHIYGLHRQQEEARN